MSCGPCALAAMVAGLNAGEDCCDECAERNAVRRATRAVLFGKPRITVREKVEVGRSYPAAEISEHDAAVEQLRADIVHHDSTKDTTEQQAQWAKITHQFEGYRLRWGQFKSALANSLVTWWGSDDEQEFSTLKNEYNQIRKDVSEFTTVVVTAPEAPVATEGLKDDERSKKGLFGQLGLPSWFVPAALGVGALILLGPALAPVLGGVFASKAVGAAI